MVPSVVADVNLNSVEVRKDCDWSVVMCRGPLFV